MSSADREIASYFELAAAEVEFLEEGLMPMTFGEFLVDNRALSRAQLYEVLREQDRHPGIPLGEIVSYLGYLSYPQVEHLLNEWNALPVVEV